MNLQRDWMESEPLVWLARAVVWTVAFVLLLVLYAVSSPARAAADDFEQQTLRIVCEPPPGVRCIVRREDIEQVLASTLKLHKQLEEAEAACKALPQPDKPVPRKPVVLDGQWKRA